MGILHLGSHDAKSEARVYARACKDGPVVYVEALPDVFVRLQKNVANFENHLALCACIGETDNEEVTFHRANNEMSSSVLAFGTHLKEHPSVQFIADLTLKTSRVDTLLRENGIEMPQGSMLVCDLQGLDLVGLRSMGDVLSKFTAAIVEVNRAKVYKKCALDHEINEFLAEFGFEEMATFWAGPNLSWGDRLLCVRRKKR